ncbi:MAG: HAMP domain-containing sensor histidine kinase [Silvibacterium sp.]
MNRVDTYRNGADGHDPAAERGRMGLDQVAEILRENQKLITLGRLTASIAHEINNPLESITNLLYLMEQDEPRKTPEYLKMAQREMGRVVQISKQTLTFSRDTSMPVRVQLADLVEEVLGLHARRIGDKSLRVVRQYEAHEPVLIFPGELRQVFSNLISNAIEATSPHGRIVIRIRAARRWSGRDGRGLRLSIGDNGSGIQDEVRSHLGEPFFTTKGQSGTGLGLWVTQSIVDNLGGTLQIRSSTAPDRHGTVFSLFLPLNLRPLAVIPGGGEAETTPMTGTHISHRRGLRLVGQETASSVEAIEDAPDKSRHSPAPMRLRVSGD